MKAGRLPGRVRMLLIVGAAFSSAIATPARGEPTQAPPGRFDPAFTAWAEVLTRAATREGVRYGSIRGEDRDLNRQSMQFVMVTRKQYDRFARPLQLAFLINAHNLYALVRVVRSYPVDSIEKTKWFGSALEDRSIPLLGRRWSLAELRAEALSGRFADARVVFALNWAMAGCAPLAPVPYTEANLEELLERQTRLFVRDPRYNRYERAERRYRASSLLKEYKAEIERDYASLFDFIKRFSRPEVTRLLERRAPRIAFENFEQALNDAGP